MTRYDDLRERAGKAGWLPRPDRRTLLVGGGAAAGLTIAWALWPRSETVAINANAREHVLGNYLKVARDGRVTVLVPQAELGQGAYTLIAHMAADELGADWRTVAVEPTPISAVYANHLLLEEDAEQRMPRFAVPPALADIGGWRRRLVAGSAPAMLTGGSTTQRMFETPVRESAALARAMLCMAAAARWDVDWQACATADGFVTHDGKRLRFGDLAEAAAGLDPPEWPPLRPPGAGPLFGEALPRLDLPAKIDGSLNFAGDIRLPDMVYAAIRQGPIGDTRLVRYNRAAPARITGYLSAVRHERWVAAVATNSWAAQRALDAMDPVFASTGQRADSSTADRRLKAAFDDFDGNRLIDVGSVAEAFDGRPIFGGDYVVAPLLHQGMETRTAVAAGDGDGMRVWVATQAPGLCRAAIAEALGVAETRVLLLAMPAGGSFDRATDHDVAVQAALVARALGRPVQLHWSRTEELLRDIPRPAVRARMRASLSQAGTVDAWHAAIATPPARHEWRARLTGARPHAAMVAARGTGDAAAIAGAVPPYRIPHLAIDHLPVDTTLPAGAMRGGADGFTVFFTECFIDELARTAGSDPLGFRMAMLGDAPDLARCLQVATEIGGWEGGLSGSGQGLACCSLRGSHIAVMAVARPGAAGLIVERLVAAVDVGRVLNPTLVRQQIEGGVLFGLAAAVGATTRYRQGLARARRLGEIGLPTLAQMPDIVVEIVEHDRDPGGVGEVGVPPVAPAIANALFTVTGQRARRLPLSSKAVP